MDLGLQGKIAVVAGGSKGFGEATAKRLAAEGARLVLAARGEDGLARVAHAIGTSHGAEVATVSADLTEAGAAERIAAAAVDRFGGIDILVSSVGAAGGGAFWDIADQVWQDALTLKFLGNVRMMRAVLPTMRQQQAGRMVIIVGQLGKQPHPRLLPSAAANAALLSVVKGLADEVAGEGIVLNAVNPGPSRTDRWNNLMAKLSRDSGRAVRDIEAEYTRTIPMGRFGEPDEIARHVCFLASEAAGYMTGTSVTVDGGWLKLPA
jgi:3-oxoacyl-[acyl-carrier protein] reductase